MEAEQLEVLNFISQHPPFDELPEEQLKNRHSCRSGVFPSRYRHPQIWRYDSRLVYGTQWSGRDLSTQR